MNEEMQRFSTEMSATYLHSKLVFSTNLNSEKNHENLVHFSRVSI